MSDCRPAERAAALTRPRDAAAQREFKGMTLSEFKYIYAWEYGHRMLGRTIGLSFLIPGASRLPN